MKGIGLLFFILVTYSASGQEQAGKIITNTQAQDYFGRPSVQLKINSAQLYEFTLQSEKLMLAIIQNEIVILTVDKKLLLPAESDIKDSEIFHVYNSSVIRELLGKSDQEWVYIEQRNDVLTITNESFTLEYGLLCPPYCN